MVALKFTTLLLLVLLPVGKGSSTDRDDQEFPLVLSQFMIEVRQQLNNIETKVTYLESKVMKLEEDNQESRAIAGVSNNTEELEERVEVLEATVVELGEDVDLVEQSIDTLQIDVSVMEINLEDVELRLDVEENVSQTHTAQIEGLQSDYNSLSERTNEIEQALNGIGNFSFLATISEEALSVTDGQILVFDEVRMNVGDNYDPSTGAYTVLVDGFYLFTVHILSNDQAHGGGYLRVDEVRTAFSRHRDELEFDHPFELTVLLELMAGQIVDVENYVQTSIHGTEDDDGAMYSWFTGYLMKAN